MHQCPQCHCYDLKTSVRGVLNAFFFPGPIRQETLPIYSYLMAAKQKKTPTATGNSIAKAPTGIPGLDQITEGGFPAGRPTLVCGSAGCGKTMLAAEFLVKGGTEFDAPGVSSVFQGRA